jgi:hypothetical protein
MNYVRVEWKHPHQDEPILLYSELDEERFEVRKIEVFRNGHAALRAELVPAAVRSSAASPYASLMRSQATRNSSQQRSRERSLRLFGRGAPCWD